MYTHTVTYGNYVYTSIYIYMHCLQIESVLWNIHDVQNLEQEFFSSISRIHLERPIQDGEGLRVGEGPFPVIRVVTWNAQP